VDNVPLTEKVGMASKSTIGPHKVLTPVRFLKSICLLRPFLLLGNIRLENTTLPCKTGVKKWPELQQ